MRPADTSPEAWQVWLELVRKMTPAERLQRALDLSETVRELGKAGIREAHPNAGERELFLRFAHRQLGDNLFCKVYGNELDAYGSAERNA
ncbi:MAG TPA: hypothetical protein VNV86_19965 [Candidatus Acidoferrum sp.]|jgi:hypothetical protein|nr:hypothetical protein [Candidatus Acidoferrum sp.]